MPRRTRVSARRLGIGLLLSLALWAGIATVAFVAVHAQKPPGPPRSRPEVFSHLYPPDPVPFERPPVGTVSPTVPAADRVTGPAVLGSLAALAARLPPGTLTAGPGGSWTLRQPVELKLGAVLDLTGPESLELAPGAFLVAEGDASVQLSGMTVTAVGPDGRPASRPTPRRGFLLARSGARLVLRDDRILDLGHLADQAYGLTLDAAAADSQVAGCSIQGGYFGVYLARMHGGLVTRNTIVHSTVYGIDPHTWNSGLVITHNTVRHSGVHGIVLADHTARTTLADNLISGAGDHGIVVYAFSDHNRIIGNRVSETFDGIVVADSSHNLLRANLVDGVTRFGLRMEGLSYGNAVLANTFEHAIVGAYVYRGPAGNRLVGNRFRADYEYLRIRPDAPRNLVLPVPPRSEL
jgi:parallel beta-helix repeat protein